MSSHCASPEGCRPKSGSESYLRNPRTLFPAQLLRFSHEHVRADSNVLRIRSTIRQSEHFISSLEAFSSTTVCTELFDCTAELYTQDLRRTGWNGVHAFALEQVHAVQTKSANADEGLGCARRGTGDIGDVKGRDRAFAVFDILRNVSIEGKSGLGYRPTARILSDILQKSVYEDSWKL